MGTENYKEADWERRTDGATFARQPINLECQRVRISAGKKKVSNAMVTSIDSQII